jgi:hypothetical protein
MQAAYNTKNRENSIVLQLDNENRQLTDLLWHFDQDLANQCRARGCPHCSGRLHRACYRRKPRGTGSQWCEQYCWRFSFCCAEEECRARATPPSLLYLGQRVYLGAVVALSACLEQGLSAQRVAALNLVLEVPRRTLKRWRTWWQAAFVHTAFWQLARARLMPPLNEQQLPLSLLERFAESALAQQLVHFLRFISALSASRLTESC